MEVLQCDGCDFRAESYDDLKTHIQDVHTAFLQPTEVVDGTPGQSRSESPNSLSHAEEDEEFLSTGTDDAGLHSEDTDLGQFSNNKPRMRSQTVNQTNKSTKQFFQCKFCVRYFRSESLLMEHTRKIHGTALESRENSLQTAKQTNYSIRVAKVFSCQHCTFKFTRKSKLLKHQKKYHKDVLLDSTAASQTEEEAEDTETAATETESGDLPTERLLEDGQSHDDDVLRKKLDAMYKSVSKSSGNLTCEWCDFEATRKETWYDHMTIKHGSMLKVTTSLKGDCESSKSGLSSPRSSPTSHLNENDLNGNKDTTEKDGVKSASGISSLHYAQITSKVPNSTGSSILSDRATFVMSDMSNSALDMDASLLNDSGSSSEEEELDDIDDSNYKDSLSAEDSLKLQLSEEDNEVLETKGVPFTRHMNRFKCPFCSFLTMHRRSISRHIENMHLSGKATLYKCDECDFICTSQVKLESHKQTNHNGSSSDWETMDLTSESLGAENERADPLNGESAGSKVNGRKQSSRKVTGEKNHRCSLCSFASMTVKGLRIHHQIKHAFCDESLQDDTESSVNEQQEEAEESETNSLTPFVQKIQTSIWGNASKKNLVGKTARKSINDQPLDLSPVKKRTRIDEIANNLQSKICQNQQQEDVIDLGDGEGDFDLDKNNHNFMFNPSDLYLRAPGELKEGRRSGKRKRNLQAKGARHIPVQVMLSDDEDNENSFGMASDKSLLLQNSQDAFQESVEYTEERGSLFYCKHCDYQNKSARSVSTHYQRMHPYIKFSFRYILDPEDQSAVFRCLECYVEYTNFNDLNQHYMEHHPGASNVLNLNHPNLIYMCRFCSYTSPNVRSLMPHYQRMHPTVKINNAMIFSSYMVDQPQKSSQESQTLREILNSGPKSLSSSSAPASRSSSSPCLKIAPKAPESSSDTETLKDTIAGGNVVVYDCDMCSFASPNMHSVLVHYQKKHPEQKASYFRIQKTMRVISVDRNQASSNSHQLSSTPKQANAVPLGPEEDVFYCKHCVYSNRSVVGVLVHYQKRHPEIKVTAKYIKHAPPTPGLVKIMDELQIAPPKQFFKLASSNGVGNSSTKGGGEKGEAEMLFFCQHCEYGNRTVKGVLIHYQKKHKDVKANADLVRRHTAVVRSQRERAQMIQSGSPSVATTVSTSDKETSQKLRSLKCRHCPYTSPYVYALRKHLKKDHSNVKATAITILNWGFQDGILEAGYHCEWCIYSHVEPGGLLMHYQRRHPEHNVDYTYMASKLWAGPDASQQGGLSDTKHYQCRDCAYEATSIWDITNHYQAVHPWAIKVDESVLLEIIKGNQIADTMHPTLSKGHIPAAMSSPFDSYHADKDEGPLDVSRPSQERLSFTTTSISTSPYQCTVCLSEYNSLHGLLTHYGKKHPGMKVKAADFAHESDINPSSVYKCRHCPYVNSRIHGVLTHYQKRHPLVKVTAEDFADDVEQMKDLVIDGEEKCKTQRQGFGAYRCKMCPYTHGTLEKLKIHYEKYHNQPASDMFNSAASPFTTSKEGQAAECSSAASAANESQEARDFDLTLSQFEKGEKHAVFRCQLCKYFCSTRKGIARHYRIKHNNVRAQPEGKNNVFKCALCPYTNPIRKGLAAHYQKRHDIDAYYTHCLAASKAVTDTPPKITMPVTSDTDGMSEELKLALERRKCSLCAFQAFSRKSIVSHYIKRHPGVFPKRQHSSKLGRYFTVIYQNDKNGSSNVEDERESSKLKSEAEQEKDLEWLPFKCLKCHKLCFSSADLLCMHYNDYHSRDLRRDFITIASPEHGGVGDGEGGGSGNSEFYQCAHCDLKFLVLTELTNHLMDHNEESQKRAMRQERRKQLQSKQKAAEQTEARQDKVDANADQTPIGYRCNFCVEVHPTLRAICNHLRKHVQYGEAKEGQLKDVSEMSLPGVEDSVSNGNPDDMLPVDEDAATASPDVDVLSVTDVAAAPSVDAVAIAMETGEKAVIPGAPLAEEEKEQRVGGHPCVQCDRVFMSMQGLRSHERSHSAMALFSREDKYNCQYCQFVSPFRHNLDRHIQSHHGHHKPFRCKLCPFKSAYLRRLKSHLAKAHAGENPYKCLTCSFSSATISQLKDHSLRVHGKMLALPKLRAGAALHTPRSLLTGDLMTLTPEGEEPGYLEPADVQQQLSHYQLASRNHSNQMACSPPSASAVLAESRPEQSTILTCEFCEFSSGYMQSLRRHYRDRHGGKKLFKCKDCSFFTCYKSTFTIHVEAGHNIPPEEGHKDLRCPFCLYHTKCKSNMIDHVVLHREERVVPLEVSRSKLSRHLQGLVFRCHKCTFTCSSDESLQQHIHKHNEIKPYQCQLCYYDTKHKQALEEHLRDEHKVIRNFEIMGRVCLDQMEALKDSMTSLSSEEEEDEQEEEQEPEVETVKVEEEEEGEEEEEEEDRKDVLVDDKMDVEVEEPSERPEPEGGGPSEVAVSPGSSGTVSPVKEKRFPCEFCGRSFTNRAEWERHVLRHGMSVSDSSDASLIPAIAAPPQPLTGSVSTSGRGAGQSSSAADEETDYPTDLSNSTFLNEKNKEMLDQK